MGRSLKVSFKIQYFQPFDGSSPLSVVIMDNCSIHRTDQVVHLIEKQLVQKSYSYLPILQT